MTDDDNDHHHTAESNAETPAEPSAPPVPKKSGGLLSKFVLLLLVLILVLAGGGLTAVTFKDQDERARAISDAIDDAVKDPQAFVSALPEKLTQLQAKIFGDAGSRTASEIAKIEPTKTEANKSDAARSEAMKHEAAPPMEPPRSAPAAAPMPMPGWAQPKEVEEPKALAAPAARPAPENSSEHAVAHEDWHELRARLERVEKQATEALETARAAVRAREEAHSGAGQEKPEAAALADQSANITALEGRIDELSGEIRQIRTQLEQPKSDLRPALADASAAKSRAEPPAQALVGVQTLALVESVTMALNQSRPFAAELAALEERGVDAQRLAELAPVAEKGAPNAEALLADFAGAAKKLRAIDDETGAQGLPLLDRLLHNLAALVRVHPVGAPTVTTIPEAIARIEKALTHGDIDGASDAFSSLPENAKSAAQSFGDALNRRQRADRAAAALLAAAIGGLSHLKN